MSNFVYGALLLVGMTAIGLLIALGSWMLRDVNMSYLAIQTSADLVG